MRNTIRKALACLLLLCLTAGLCSGCIHNEEGQTPKLADNTPTLSPVGEEISPAPDAEPVYVPSGPQLVKDKVYGEDYISLYDQFGRDGASIKDVTEDPDTGLAYYNAPDGKTYELGLDFLSMAMVFNTDPAGSKYATEDEVYAAWWRYYVTRWNSLLPEIPLYCYEYYDAFSVKITGVENHPSNPYWSPAQALPYWESQKEDNSLILGSTEELTGKFRFPEYGEYGGSVDSSSAGDREINRLITGLETVVTDPEGRYVVNPTAVRAFETTENEDGTVTFTITIYDDLRFSDGSPVTAKSYLYMPMVFSSCLAKIGVSRVPSAYRRYVGYDDYQAYNGWDEAQAYLYSGAVPFAGLRLLDEYTFSVTVTADNTPYFFSLEYAAFYPTHRDLWVGNGDVADDGEGCYFTEGFYEEGEALELPICTNAVGADPSIPCAGPYMFVSWDENAGRVELRRNPYFKGNFEGVTPRIETVMFKTLDQEERLDALRSGSVDYVSGLTGPENAEAVAALAAGAGGHFACTHYSRAGYGKLAFRCDFGPVQFPEVRQTIALCMDRPAFAKEFTGEDGTVVDGPYYPGSWMYQAAVKQGLSLDPYAVSLDRAIRVLEEGGWIYDKDGNPYTEGVRYKRIPAEYITGDDKDYVSLDGEYTVTRIGDYYYMPLVLNWFGTEDNDFSVLLEERFEGNELLAAAGFRVFKTLGAFAPMLDELYQLVVYGYYAYTPRYNVFNFATGYNSPVYDYSFNMTVDPSMYDDYSAYYLKDTADIWWIGEEDDFSQAHTAAPIEEPDYVPTGPQLVENKKYGEDGDYISLYERFGKEISIADVEEDSDGTLLLNAPDGNRYELGLDFLTMAMVYNTDPAGSEYADEDEVFAAWWRYYITRWNRLLPEIPLYSEEYFDFFNNTAVRGVTEHPTNAFQSPAEALVFWSSSKEDGSLVLGSTETPTGLFRYPAFFAAYESGANAGDRDVCRLISGLETVVSTPEGGYALNETVVKDLEISENADGTATLTITLHRDLKFSDGSPVTAKNYLYAPMVFSTPVGREAAERSHAALGCFVGYDEFASYDGTEGSGARAISGVRLLGDDRFSVTLKSEYYPYFYALSLAAFSPTHRSLWLGEADLADDGEGCYLTANFYENRAAQTALIQAHAEGADPSIPSAGPYALTAWDEAAKRVTLTRNRFYKGNYEGVTPEIETVFYQTIAPEDRLDALLEGRADYVFGVPAEEAEKQDLLLWCASGGVIEGTSYTRAGYGKLAFSCDFGPVQFPEVRRAIAFCLDRDSLAREAAGDWSTVPDGPCSTDSWMYKAAIGQGMKLYPYPLSLDAAIEALEEGGWIYDKDGNPYTEGVRYKRIPAAYATKGDREYRSLDGKYTVIQVGGDYYMPLVLNWFGNQDGASTPALEHWFEQNSLLELAGMKVYKNLGTFTDMLDELYQTQVYYYYYVPRLYCVFNFATGYNSPMYDYSFNMTVDPSMYDDYSAYYLKDTADIFPIR